MVVYTRFKFGSFGSRVRSQGWEWGYESGIGSLVRSLVYALYGVCIISGAKSGGIL